MCVCARHNLFYFDLSSYTSNYLSFDKKLLINYILVRFSQMLCHIC